ncbi:MAG TPA: hypothetical protein VN783_11855, partial [Thermoanaerobaculia bacterium]|nr:hypothetical protein [Thermoanaerobaculia bacterium]
MQQLFEELAARLPDFVAMHEDLAIERARRGLDTVPARKALPKKRPPAGGFAAATDRRGPSRKG